MNKLKKWEEKKWLIIGAMGLIVLSILLIMIRTNSKQMSVEDIPITSVSSTTTQEMTAQGELNEEMYVDIKGAVAKPGIYKVTGTMRVLNVVELAGGFLSDADDKQVNLSERVTDQMVIYIPKEGEQLEEVPIAKQNDTREQKTEDSNLVNLNTATIEELKTLNGVGEKKAENIIKYREEIGLFNSIEDLKKVDGIGEKTFENLKSSITI